ncbi:hypothetical protein L4D77_17885 [Photobacterium frigidiphilum]|uniref:hypothetical protein n=1 Tax=Photobacterium frigidiphilum TaxID=264736 RepID=UPI003D1450CD
MSLLNKHIKKALSIQSLKEQFDVPEQAYHIKQANDGTTLQAKGDITELLVIEVQYKNTGYKEQYIVDPDLIEQLDRKAYRIKVLHIIKTEAGELKCIMIPLKTKNSWHVSNLELLTQAEKSPVTVKRDPIAKVYETHSATDVEPITITDEDVEQAYLNAFGKYEITSLDHPALVGKLKSSPIVDVVDESEIELLDDTDAAVANFPASEPLEELIEIELGEDVEETHVPVSGSLEELQASLLPITDLKDELELDLDGDLDDESLEFDEISIDDIDIDELAA